MATRSTLPSLQFDLNQLLNVTSNIILKVISNRKIFSCFWKILLLPLLFEKQNPTVYVRSTSCLILGRSKKCPCFLPQTLIKSVLRSYPQPFFITSFCGGSHSYFSTLLSSQVVMCVTSIVQTRLILFRFTMWYSAVVCFPFILNCSFYMLTFWHILKLILIPTHLKLCLGELEACINLK